LNYNSLAIGEEVAFVHYRNRGLFPLDAIKAEVLDRRKRKKWGNTSQTGEVLLSYTRHERELQEWISAYNVIDFWDRYEEERDAIKHRKQIEREERDRQWEARRIERQRQEDEKLREQRQLEADLLIRFGIPLGSVTHFSPDTITITKDALTKILQTP
jgi:hypothetical protein